MNSKIAITISVFAAVLMLLPGAASAYTMGNGHRAYTLGNYDLKVAGNNIFVSSGNNSVKETWYYSIDLNGTLVKQNLKVGNITRISNGQTNLLGIERSNKYIKADEIYYSNGNQLDTSLAVQNLMDGNETPVVSLEVQHFKAGNTHLFNVNGKKAKLPYNNLLIPNPKMTPFAGASLGSFFMNWNHAVGLMGPIGITNNSDGQAIDLTVLNTIMQENQTASINLGSNFQGVNLDNSPGQSPFPFYNSQMG